jgi:hypothetical protein
MIELGITAAIVQNKATHQSIGALSDKSALVEGNIVALYNVSHGSFVRLDGKWIAKVDPKQLISSPLTGILNVSLVVNAGKGRFALYSPRHRRFLAAQNGHAEPSVYPIAVKLEDRPRCNETFREHCYGDGSCFLLCCDIEDLSTTATHKIKWPTVAVFRLYKSMDLNRPSNERAGWLLAGTNGLFVKPKKMIDAGYYYVSI